ncbi:MAG: DUF1552 domain-containing protein [Deltaproteobacteria bacterium]|nr:DUF1552 domain-containing protein [Deltaproteobacteria bacterium]
MSHSPRGPSRWSRRAFLGGAGVAVALPFLASLAPRRARGDEPAVPSRLVFWYVPNGMHLPSWIPATTGAGYALPRILEPLAAHKDDVLVVSNLSNRPGRPDGPGDHGAGTGAFLTCFHVHKTEGDDIENGVSVDQLAARVLGVGARLPSLELGLEGGDALGGCDSGYSCAYTRNIAWAGPQTPLPKVTNPRIVFDRLFQGFDPSATEAVRARRTAQRKSVLDWVKGEANALSMKVGGDDRKKLDEYLTGVRELELRIDQSGQSSQGGPSVCAPGDYPPEDFDVQLQIDLMNELTATALTCDLTRVVTFMLANAGSGRSYTFVDPSIVGGHHDLSHHMDDPENHRRLELIDRWEVAQLARLLDKLAANTESDGRSTLDHTLCFFSSEIADGNAHTHDDLPVLLAGGAALARRPFVTGRHLRTGAGTPIANLFMSMLAMVGAPVTSFGDGTTALDLG